MLEIWTPKKKSMLQNYWTLGIKFKIVLQPYFKVCKWWLNPFPFSIIQNFHWRRRYFTPFCECHRHEPYSTCHSFHIWGFTLWHFVITGKYDPFDKQIMWPTQRDTHNVTLTMWPTQCDPHNVTHTMWLTQCDPHNKGGGTDRKATQPW